MSKQTEYEFTLPKGYMDSDGTFHRHGTMRLATAADEILPLSDPRVQLNPSYMTIILLSRVVTKLGQLTQVDIGTIEKLFTMDLIFLQDLYERINGNESPCYNAVCPKCGQEVSFPINIAGNSR